MGWLRGQEQLLYQRSEIDDDIWQKHSGKPLHTVQETAYLVMTRTKWWPRKLQISRWNWGEQSEIMNSEGFFLHKSNTSNETLLIVWKMIISAMVSHGMHLLPIIEPLRCECKIIRLEILKVALGVFARRKTGRLRTITSTETLKVQMWW